MTLYNTLTKKVETFKPLEGKTVRLYSCGPTVYDHAHIGNLSAFIAADTLKRVLRAEGYTVHHVMNFTDVDDKTIKRSRQEFPDLKPQEALKKLTRKYEELFLEDMQAIGNSIDDITFVRATEAIIEMQVLISVLHENDFAYIADDGIYFSIERYKQAGKKYGQLSHVDTQSTSKERIANDEYDKSSAHDFALWKFKKEGEPSWDFKLQGQNYPGRPGWHIECSAMSTMKLGQPFDIHTGGIDLIFPHHENEIAQSTATKKENIYANFFVHSDHILVNRRKMSKSASNYYTLQDIQKKGFDPLAFRLFVLQSHYRKQSNFTWENLRSAQSRLKQINKLGELQWQTIGKTEWIKNTSVIREMTSNFTNDINSPLALATLNSFYDRAEDMLIHQNEKQYLKNTLQDIDNLLGTTISKVKDLNVSQKKLILERDKARSEKDWQRADELRENLIGEGVEVRDTTHGQIWSRK